MRERILVMNDPHAMRINKELAREIGFQESIVFLQMEYLIANSESVVEGPDGVPRRWKRLPLEDLQERHFPWWSAATLHRILNRLKERNLILTDDTLNTAGYDRTQWYAVDEEGVETLHSVAIFQNEKSNFHSDGLDLSDCKMETVNLQNAGHQNERTIRKEVSKEPQETSPNGDAKKPPASSPGPGSRLNIRRLGDDEAQDRFDRLCGSDPHGDELARLAEILAEENATGRVAITRVWREIGERYVKKREDEDLSEEAWAYGFDQAIGRQAPNVGYVVAAAKGYRPGRDRGPVRAATRTEADYDEAGY